MREKGRNKEREISKGRKNGFGEREQNDGIEEEKYTTRRRNWR